MKELKNKHLKRTLLENIDFKESHNKEYQLYYYENLNSYTSDKRLSKNVLQGNENFQQIISSRRVPKYPLKKSKYDNVDLFSKSFLEQNKKIISLFLEKERVFSYRKTFNFYQFNQKNIFHRVLNIGKVCVKLLYLIKHQIKTV